MRGFAAGSRASWLMLELVIRRGRPARQWVLVRWLE